MAIKIARHLGIAASQGVSAGMEAFLSTPISKQHPNYREIMSKRTDKTKLAAYCNLYGISQKAAPIVKTSAVDAMQAQIEALKAQIAGKVEVVADPVAAMQAQIDELKAQLAGKGAEVAATPRLVKPRPWDLTGKSVAKDGTFVHITKATKDKASQRITYKALTFEEAIEALEACYTVNTRYCVRVS